MAQWTYGLAALALTALAGGVALARGPNMNLPIFGAVPGGNFWGPSEPAVRYQPDDEDRPVRRAKPKRASVAAFGAGQPICVRLCDGSFFPTSTTTGGDAACAAQCPDAPTALYTMPGDRIEDAVSSAGAPYSKLPVAKRYQTSFENTCACHRDGVATRDKDLLRDATLRKGDVVMTASGFKVFQGDGYGPNGPADFVALSGARVPKDERATLAAMERASTGSRAPSAPALVAARPKGNVTVDNGPAKP